MLTEDEKQHPEGFARKHWNFDFQEDQEVVAILALATSLTTAHGRRMAKSKISEDHVSATEREPSSTVVLQRHTCSAYGRQQLASFGLEACPDCKRKTVPVCTGACNRGDRKRCMWRGTREVNPDLLTGEERKKRRWLQRQPPAEVATNPLQTTSHCVVST